MFSLPRKVEDILVMFRAFYEIITFGEPGYVRRTQLFKFLPSYLSYIGALSLTPVFFELGKFFGQVLWVGFVGKFF